MPIAKVTPLALLCPRLAAPVRVSVLTSILTPILTPILALFLQLAGASPASSAAADQDPLQFSIDALTRADACLYMLQSSRDPQAGDCVALREFHENSFLGWMPDLDSLDDGTRRRVVNNRQSYLQTLDDIAKEIRRLQ